MLLDVLSGPKCSRGRAQVCDIVPRAQLNILMVPFCRLARDHRSSGCTWVGMSVRKGCCRSWAAEGRRPTGERHSMKKSIAIWPTDPLRSCSSFGERLFSRCSAICPDEPGSKRSFSTSENCMATGVSKLAYSYWVKQNDDLLPASVYCSWSELRTETLRVGQSTAPDQSSELKYYVWDKVLRA